MNLKAIRTNPWPYAIIGWMLLFGTGMAVKDWLARGGLLPERTAPSP